jgi:hypothetical protein
MAIAVDWITREVTIPKADLLLVQSTPTEIRQLDLNLFRLELKELESGQQGVPYLITHNHVKPITVGGVTLARVVELVNDYTVTFEDGQYAVNLLGANSNVGDRVNVNSVSVRSSNSAGLTYSKEVEDQSFVDGRIYVNTLVGNPGVNFPRGTAGDPVNSLGDAMTIINNRKLGKRLFFIGSAILNSGSSLTGYNLKGDFYANSVLQLASGSSSQNMTAENVFFSSSYHDTNCQYINCLMLNCVNLSGYILQCKIAGALQIASDSDFLSCYGTAIIAPVAPALTINIVNFSGDLTIANVVDANTKVSIGVISGVVRIHSSCVAGTITVVDHDGLVDESGPGCTVIVINQHVVTQEIVGEIPENTWSYTRA